MKDKHYQKKINFTEEILSNEDSIAMKNSQQCMFEITLGVQNMHGIEIASVNENDVISSINRKKYQDYARRQTSI